MLTYVTYATAEVVGSGAVATTPNAQQENSEQAKYPQGVFIDQTLLPGMEAAASFIGQWHEPGKGTIYQMEGCFTPLWETMRDIQIEFEPAGCVDNIWNLHPIEAGRLYKLESYYTSPEWKNGLHPGDDMPFGGLFTTNKIKIILHPHQANQAHQEI